MVDPLHQLALDVAVAAGGVGATAVPVAGTGPVPCTVVVRAEQDQVADFPELREFVGAQQLGWTIQVRFTEYPQRFVPLDRLTLDDGTVHEVRGCQAHPVAPAWVLATFIVEPDESVSDTDAFMLPFYFAGTTGLGL